MFLNQFLLIIHKYLCKAFLHLIISRIRVQVLSNGFEKKNVEVLYSPHQYCRKRTYLFKMSAHIWLDTMKGVLSYFGDLLVPSIIRFFKTFWDSDPTRTQLVELFETRIHSRFEDKNLDSVTIKLYTFPMEFCRWSYNNIDTHSKPEHVSSMIFGIQPDLSSRSFP